MLKALVAPSIVVAVMAIVLPAVSMAACNERAPTLEIEVVSAPLEWRLDHEATLNEINRGAIVDGMLSLGDTSGAMEVGYDYKAWGPKPGAGTEACPRAKIRLDVSVNPIVIRIGREVPVDTCIYDLVREHEWRHVQVYAAALERAPAGLKEALELAETDATGPDQQTRLQDAAARWLNDQSAAIKAAHTAIDAPEEYARVSEICKDLLASTRK